MSTREEMQRLDALREHKKRSIPVKCVHHSFDYLTKGEVGLVSPEKLMFGRAFLKVVDCPEFDADNYPGYGKPTKKKKVKETDNAE